LLVPYRGWVIPPEYIFRDVWGNSSRRMLDTGNAADVISSILNNMLDISVTDPVKNAREFMESRTWDKPVAQLDATLREILDDTKTE